MLKQFGLNNHLKCLSNWKLQAWLTPHTAVMWNIFPWNWKSQIRYWWLGNYQRDDRTWIPHGASFQAVFIPARQLCLPRSSTETGWPVFLHVPFFPHGRHHYELWQMVLMSLGAASESLSTLCKKKLICHPYLGYSFYPTTVWGSRQKVTCVWR